ncbi:uncharacterized protein [Hemitrygon akajei]|uniref:uncharacterized protein isoform X1 n=1 Tax=Hemitrygon akajei TaxID=2704970 RepID=UPI003BF9698E
MHTEYTLQLQLAKTARAFRLTVSLKKTMILHQNPPCGIYNPPLVTIDEHPLTTVEQFTYLGSIISLTIDSPELAMPLGGSRMCGRTTSYVCPQKSRCYRAAVITKLLYGFEACVLYCKQIQLQECSISAPPWVSSGRAVSPTTRSWRKLKSQTLKPLCCSGNSAGQATRLAWSAPGYRKQYSTENSLGGKRDHGAPRERYKDQLEQQFSEANIELNEWQQLACDRDLWRTLIHGTAKNFEESRRTNASEKKILLPKHLHPNCSCVPTAPESADPELASTVTSDHAIIIEHETFSIFHTAACPSILPTIILYADIVRFSPTVLRFLSG